MLNLFLEIGWHHSPRERAAVVDLQVDSRTVFFGIIPRDGERDLPKGGAPTGRAQSPDICCRSLPAIVPTFQLRSRAHRSKLLKECQSLCLAGRIWKAPGTEVTPLGHVPALSLPATAIPRLFRLVRHETNPTVTSSTMPETTTETSRAGGASLFTKLDLMAELFRVRSMGAVVRPFVARFAIASIDTPLLPLSKRLMCSGWTLR